MIIDKLGDYRTRDGQRAKVLEIKNPITIGTTNYPVKGQLYSLYRGKELARGYEIWTLHGEFIAGHSHSLNLVEFIG